MLNFKKYFPVFHADKLTKHGIHLSFLSQSEMEKLWSLIRQKQLWYICAKWTFL